MTSRNRLVREEEEHVPGTAILVIVRVIMRHPAFRNVPFLLEVPGVDKTGPDKENLDRLKLIRAQLGIPA